MRARDRVHALVEATVAATGRCLGRVVSPLGTGVVTLVGRVAYRRREIIVVTLLAGSLLGGLAVERWRERAPALLERLEAEPPRLAPATRAAGPRAVTAARQASCAERTTRAGHGSSEPRSPAPTPEAPLDLNRATAAELARLPGIGPKLAERILARRATLGGRFDSPDDLATVPGLGRRKAIAVTAFVTVGTEARLVETPGHPAEAPGPPP